MWSIYYPEWIIAAANFAVLYGTLLIIHSTIIISIGLATAILVTRAGSSAQSLVLRSFLTLTLLWIFISPHISFSGKKSIDIEIPKILPYKNQINYQNNLLLSNNKSITYSSYKASVNSQNVVNTYSASQTDKNLIKTPEKPLIQTINYQDIPVKTLPRKTGNYHDIKAVLYVFFLFLWIAFFLFFIVRILLNICYLFYLKKISDPAGQPILIKCIQAAAELNVKAPDVLQNHQIKSPFIAGIIRPVIFLPSDETLIDNTSYEVFLHELSHLKRHDNLWNFAQHLIKAVIPFQPLVWVLAKWIEETSDYACDDYVIKHTYSNYDYANGLFQLALYHNPVWREKVAGVGILSFQSTLSKRITRILDSQRIIRTETGKKFVACVSFVCFLAVIVTGMFAVKEKAYAIMTQNLIIPVYNSIYKTDVYSLFISRDLVIKKNVIKKTGLLKAIKSSENFSPENNPDTEINNIINSDNINVISEDFDSVLYNVASYKTEFDNVTPSPSAGHIDEKITEPQPKAEQKENLEISPDTQTGNFSNKPLFTGNTALSMSGFKETRIRMPSAKALNVEVDFDYKNYNFDLNNKDDRQLYNLYRNLDKNKNEPAWSPDGKWIAFTDHNRIWLVSSGGGEPKIIFEEDLNGYSIGNFESISFAPDSKEITFKKDVYDESKGSSISIKGISTPYEYMVLSNPIPNIESVNINTREHHVVVEEGYSGTWSHSGRYLCYLNWALETGPDAAKFGLPVIFDKQTGEKHFLPVDNKKRYGSPSFSPDDKFISLPVRDQSGPIELFRIPLDNGEPEQLTVYNETDTHGKYRNFPEYSPDGNWLLYTDFTWSGNKPDKRLFVYNMTTRNIYEVFEKAFYPNSYGRWSPDGSKICYLSEEEDGNYIYICDFFPETFKKAVNSEITKPLVFKLNSNYPNPFNISTTIEYSIPESGHVTLDIYNISGQKVTELINGRITSGNHSIVWNSTDNRGNSVSSGVYISRLQFNGRSLTNRMTLLK